MKIVVGGDYGYSWPNLNVVFHLYATRRHHTERMVDKHMLTQFYLVGKVYLARGCDMGCFIHWLIKKPVKGLMNLYAVRA
ncbi:hypothetical protein [Tannerella forsythia]|uniref:hypothetical protein n=1 Tax=Tannerella forsythia TaxID=28112 RepID=UPI000BE76D07|nr:hypothetical protein CLI85_12405 [Tannerella forsythia]